MKNLKLCYGDFESSINEGTLGMAIVNPANKYMECVCGISKEIYEYAGKEILEQYCQTRWNKEMDINEIRITPGFDIYAEIIHIRCPQYYDEIDPIEELKECYLNLLQIIKFKDYKCVWLPSLGTELNNYMHGKVAEMVMNILQDFVEENQDVKVYLYLDDIEIVNMYKKYCK